RTSPTATRWIRASQDAVAHATLAGVPHLSKQSTPPPVVHALAESALRSLHLCSTDRQASHKVDHIQIKAVAVERPALTVDHDTFVQTVLLSSAFQIVKFGAAPAHTVVGLVEDAGKGHHWRGGVHQADGMSQRVAAQLVKFVGEIGRPRWGVGEE